MTYMGIGATKKWERIESYGPKFVENIVQAVARDLLMFSMQTLSHCFIVGHIHGEMIIEADRRMPLERYAGRCHEHQNGQTVCSCGRTGIRAAGIGKSKL